MTNENSNCGMGNAEVTLLCHHVARRPGGDLTYTLGATLSPCPWCEIERLDTEAACEKAQKESLQLEVKGLRETVKVTRQAILEFRHAQECGPSWYTHGKDGMYRQVEMWLRRGLEAASNALGPYDDNGEYLKEKQPHEPQSIDQEFHNIDDVVEIGKLRTALKALYHASAIDDDEALLSAVRAAREVLDSPPPRPW